MKQNTLSIMILSVFAAVFLIARKQKKGKVTERQATKEEIDKMIDLGRAHLT